MIRTKLLTAAMLFALMAPFVVACAPEEAEAPAAEAPAEGEAPAADAGACTDAIGCLEVAAGDKVLYGKYSGNEIDVEGQKLLILHEDEILAKI